MTPAIFSMLERYSCRTAQEYENALKEIIQQIALLGLWRSKFFEHAAFYGGTALRILYGSDRFSEDLDFSLLSSQPEFDLSPYLKAIEDELNGLGFNVTVHKRNKKNETLIESAFIKAGTKEHFLKIRVSELIAQKIQKNELISIKLDVDVDPPGQFKTEAKIVSQPIPFAINTYQMPDLFAGKIHAILERKWKHRVKGRDYYDFVWYISRGTPVRLEHLKERLRQSASWNGKKAFEAVDLIQLLRKKFLELDVNAAKKDILSFLKDTAAVDVWSQEFFASLLPSLKII